jgi:arsenate reductase
MLCGIEKRTRQDGITMKKALFVCIQNSCRSQMAEGFARYYGSGKVEAASAGTAPASTVDEGAIRVMSEKGIDISSQTPSGLEAADLEHYDLIVTMGCGVEALCPVIPEHKKRDWNLEDPEGRPPAVYRRIRDQIEKRVRDLLAAPF